MGRRLALLIGSSTYADPKLRRLHKPDADVASLASVLRDPEIGGFDDVQTHVDANVATLQRAVAALFAHKHTDDLLLLYFAGHGIKDEYGHLHLAAADTDSELLSATALSSDFITREMDRSRSRKQILVLDCCFSGAFSGTFAADAVGTTQAFTTDSVGRVILTATDAFQYAWEDEKAITDANSLFTHFLVEGIRSGNADINADGLITADEWYEFVYNAVRAASPKQTPQRSVYSGAGGLLIAHNPKPKVPLPDEIAVAMKSPLPYVREGVAHELSRLTTGEHAGLATAARDALQLLAGDRDQRVREIATTALRAGVAIAQEAPSTVQQNTLSQPVPAAFGEQPVETKPFPPAATPAAQPANTAKTPEQRSDYILTASPLKQLTAAAPLRTAFTFFVIVVGLMIFEALILLTAAARGSSLTRNNVWVTPFALALVLLAGLAALAWRGYRIHPGRGMGVVAILLAFALIALFVGGATIIFMIVNDPVPERPAAPDTAITTDTAAVQSPATAAETGTTGTSIDTSETSTSGLLNTTTTISATTATTGTVTPLPTTDYSELVAELHTSAGQIDIRFFPGHSPNHVQNFVTLAKQGFYNGTKFFYVWPDLFIKGGDPLTKSGDRSTWKNAGSDGELQQEFPSKTIKRGKVVMASRAGKEDSDDAWQFFIMTVDYTFISTSTIFGEVTGQGMAVVDAIASAPCDAEHHPDNPTTIENITFRTGHFKQ